jgi:hypothetical protein
MNSSDPERSFVEIPLASGLEQDHELFVTTYLDDGRRLIALGIPPADREREIDPASVITLLVPRDARELAAALLRAADDLELEGLA